MKVLKRNGKLEDVSFDKILKRLYSLCNLEYIDKLNIESNTFDPVIIAQKVCTEIYDNVPTSELDILSSEIAISLYTKNIKYKKLAARILISNHHKKTSNSFIDVINNLYNYKNNNGTQNSLINEILYKNVINNIELIENTIDYNLDYKLDYFGFKTLEKSYLLKINGIIVERPQHMLMRVALSIHRYDINKAMDTYRKMSNQDYIHATPTLFNAGTKREQFSSCFLLMMEDDSVEGIYDTLKDCALISQSAGGIGLAIHNIRSKGCYIRYKWYIKWDCSNVKTI